MPKRFRDLKIGTKQAASFALIVIILAIANLVSLRTLASLRADIEEITRSWLPRALTIAELNLRTTDLRQSQLQIAFFQEAREMMAQSPKIISLLDNFEGDLDTYERLRNDAQARGLYSEEERLLYESFQRKWERYQELSLEFFQMLNRGQRDSAVTALNSEMLDVFMDFRADLSELVRVNTADPFAAAKRAEEAFAAASRSTLTLLFISLVIAAIMVIIFVRLVTRPVKQLSVAAGQVAQGDLDVMIERSSGDEIGLLARSFNRMTQALREARDKTAEQEESLRQKNLDLEQALLRLQDAQQQLIMKEKMASLGQLVAGVAHEINNPVGAVNAAADNSRRAIEKLRAQIRTLPDGEKLLADQRVELLLKTLDESTGISTMASDRIARIVRSLRSFARLDEADFQKADLHEGLDTTLTLLQHELKSRVEVIKEYGTIPQILCFPNELNQVFMNLLVNAAQAIKEKGQIRITTKSDQGFVFITIADSGVGIDPKNLQRIFDPGYTTKGVGVGTGLGLSISYNIVKKHGGEITVESQPGHGAAFSIKIPIRV